MTTDIIWPEPFTPGTTDNFVSNEVIIADLSAAEVWPFLVDTSRWSSYYGNVADIDVPGDVLTADLSFSFATFGFPPLSATVVEIVAPTAGTAGRLAWRAIQEGDTETALDVHHAWIVEDLAGGRVRILTQESQIGAPAAALAKQKPNPMLNGHQDWLDGLVRASSAR